MIRRLRPISLLALLGITPVWLVQAAPSPKPAVVKRATRALPGPTWLDFDPAAIRRAQSEDRLVLLILETPWSESCKSAREKLWNQPEVLTAIRSHYVPIAVRSDLRPDLHARFPAEGWPGISLLLPDGSPLFFKNAEGVVRRVTATLMPPARLAQWLEESALYYRGQREAALKLAHEQELEIQKSARPTPGSATDDSVVWAVAQQARASFDPSARYFGGPPRLPRFDLLELMLALGAQAEDPWGTVGAVGLTTLSGKLLDPVDGGLQRMALGLDWSDVQSEKLLDRNARMLDLLALKYRRSGNKADRELALKSAQFLVEKLGRPDGSFRAGLCSACPDGRDETVLTDGVALAASALIRAGAALSEPKLVARGLAAAQFLHDQRYSAGRGVAHFVVEGRGQLLPLFLDDLSATAAAFLSAYEVSGESRWLEAARDIVRVALGNLLDKDVGALRDTLLQPSAPLPLRRSLYPLEANARMVRCLVRLRYLLDDRDAGAKARDILKAFSSSYERVPLLAAAYGLAAYEYHFQPVVAITVGKAGEPRLAALRQAALSSAYPFVIVRSYDSATQAQEIAALGLKISPEPTVYAFHAGLLSLGVVSPDGVPALIADLRDKQSQIEAARRQRQLEKQAAPGGSAAPGKQQP